MNYLGQPINKSKLLLSLAAVVFISACAYSGLKIYKHNHDKQSDKLKVSAVDLKEQTAQYSAAANAPPVSPEVKAVNEQKTVIANFYKDYTYNKTAKISQTATLAKYGTPELAVLYKSSTPNLDIMVCGGSGDISKSAISIDEPLQVDGQTVFPVIFRDANQRIQAMPRVNIVQQGSGYQIDKITCPGPV
jgi:hypothetical protein